MKWLVAGEVGAESGDSGNEGYDEDDNDEEYYRQEVGENPDKELFDKGGGSKGHTRHKVWSLTQFYSVDFSKSRIGKKVRFQQMRKQGLCRLFLTVSWDFPT